VAEPSLAQLQPEVVAERRDGSHYELDLRVPDDLAVWPGHFPEFFLVPGVLQVDWVMRLAAERLGLRAVPPRIEGLKFKTPLRPQQCFTLRLDVAADGRSIDFEMASATDVYSRGRLHLDGASH
jgi:3-hydroxymyristoyl/3-hydroxydecanoyl-(acyl carrier protein) dehydratase